MEIIEKCFRDSEHKETYSISQWGINIKKYIKINLGLFKQNKHSLHAVNTLVVGVTSKYKLRTHLTYVSYILHIVFLFLLLDFYWFANLCDPLT